MGDYTELSGRRRPHHRDRVERLLLAKRKVRNGSIAGLTSCAPGVRSQQVVATVQISGKPTFAAAIARRRTAPQPHFVLRVWAGK